jgi:hypothetical protein
MGPPGGEVISLQKVDSLIVLVNATGAKKVSAMLPEGFG